jgi:ligand-binding SRPBCC domain-containing protein
MLVKKEPIVVIERSAEIARPVQEVFEFYETPDNFRRVTDGVAGMELERLPADFRPGSVFAYRLHGWPVELRWQALLSEYQPPERLVNVQANGQFLEWSHELHFAPVDQEGNATRVRELLSYRMPKGLVNTLAHRLYVRQKLEAFVTESLDSARELLEAESRSER